MLCSSRLTATYTRFETACEIAGTQASRLLLGTAGYNQTCQVPAGKVLVSLLYSLDSDSSSYVNSETKTACHCFALLADCSASQATCPNGRCTGYASDGYQCGTNTGKAPFHRFLAKNTTLYSLAEQNRMHHNSLLYSLQTVSQ